MSSFGVAAAAALMLAGSGLTEGSVQSSAETGLDLGSAKVIQARTGYFRRDLGNDPAYTNYQHYDNRSRKQPQKPRGFRSWGYPQHNEATIYYYDGGHSYPGNYRRKWHNEGHQIGR